MLAVIGCLGLSEEIWSTFLSLHLRDQTASPDSTRAVTTAAIYVGIISSVKNLLEGFGYVIGGSIAHRLGPRVALAVSALPMALGFTIMLSNREPWAIAMGARCRGLEFRRVEQCGHMRRDAVREIGDKDLPLLGDRR